MNLLLKHSSPIFACRLPHPDYTSYSVMCVQLGDVWMQNAISSGFFSADIPTPDLLIQCKTLLKEKHSLYFIYSRRASSSASRCCCRGPLSKKRREEKRSSQLWRWRATEHPGGWTAHSSWLRLVVTSLWLHPFSFPRTGFPPCFIISPIISRGGWISPPNPHPPPPPLLLPSHSPSLASDVI